MSTATMWRRGAGLLVVALVAVAVPLSALGASYTVSLEKQIVRGSEGDRVSLGTFTMPDELIGLSCTVTATGNNNESVHIGNNIEVSSVNTVVLVGVEDAPNKVTQASGLLEVGSEVSFTLVLGPDPVYSAEFDVTFECETPETTTTTQPVETTVTTPTTETTEPEPSSTTTIPVETSSTSIATTTTVEPATSSTLRPEVSSTTIRPTTTGGATSDTLPFTGLGTEGLAVIAFAGLAAGAGLLLLTRRASDEV